MIYYLKLNPVVPYSYVFIMAVSVAEAAPVNPNGIKMFLSNGLSTFFIDSNPTFNNGPRSVPRNSRDCTILDKLVFDNFKLANKLFVKALRNFETCLSASSNLRGKFVNHSERSRFYKCM